MTALIDKLFIKSEADAIRTLWIDVNSRKLLKKSIGKQLINGKQIIDDVPLTQLMFIASLSDFTKSENECHDVAEIIYWGIHRIDIIPMVTEHHGRELAYRCLICLGLFKQYLIQRCNRYGSPSPDFYRQAGIKSFKDVGMKDISGHFSKWENFLGEFFI